MQMFTTLQEMYSSKGFIDFLDSKLGNDLFINDPDRAERMENGEHIYEDDIQDWREYLDTLKVFNDNEDDFDDFEKFDIIQEHYDNIENEINSCEEFHINLNKS